MKRVLIGLGAALVVTAVGSLIYFSLPVSAPANTSYAYEYYYTDENTSEPEDTPPNGRPSVSPPFLKDSGDSAEDGLTVDTDPASITVLVNHLYTLPSDYVPEDLVAPDVEFSFPYMADKRLMRQEAAEALEELFAAAHEDGIRLTAISGYRSYDRQKTIYLYNVNRSGEEYANLYSAPPGHSEHQTGLTMDVSSVSNGLDLTYSLADLPEGQWMAEHSHLFGFIIRYPEDKETVTGYAYEPWHLRYVGVELASYLYEQSLTLDEYYGVSAEDYEWSFDLEALRRNPGNTLPDNVLSYSWPSSSGTDGNNRGNGGTSGIGGGSGSGNTGANGTDGTNQGTEAGETNGSGESNGSSGSDGADKSDNENAGAGGTDGTSQGTGSGETDHTDSANGGNSNGETGAAGTTGDSNHENMGTSNADGTNPGDKNNTGTGTDGSSSGNSNNGIDGGSNGNVGDSGNGTGGTNPGDDNTGTGNHSGNDSSTGANSGNGSSDENGSGNSGEGSASGNPSTGSDSSSGSDSGQPDTGETGSTNVSGATDTSGNANDADPDTSSPSDTNTGTNENGSGQDQEAPPASIGEPASSDLSGASAVSGPAF